MGLIVRLVIGLAILVLVVIAAGAFLATLPGVATPLARLLLGGQDAAVARAWVSYEPSPVVHLRSIEIEGRGHAEAVDARINVLGVFPGAALIPRLSVTDGALLLELGGAKGSGPPRLLDDVVGVDLARVRLDIHRLEREPQVFDIAVAEGDIPTGAFMLEGQGGGAALTMQGDAEDLTLEGFSGRLRIEGENFADLADLLGFAGPDTPPFALTGDLSRSARTWRLSGINGNVGDSDIRGDLEIDFGRERPFVTARLVSQSLDFDDLGVIVGAPSTVEKVQPNDRQREVLARWRESDRFIPTATLDVDRLQAIDAEVAFTADSVRAGGAPLEGVVARIVLDDSVLAFDRLVFTAPQGRLDVTGKIDARDPDDVSGVIEGALTGFALSQLADGKVLRGTLTAELDVTFRGRSMRDAFASAHGRAAAWSTDAEIRALVEEAADLDVGEALAIMLAEAGEPPAFRPARCFVARAVVEDGVLRFDPAVIDTADAVTRLNGTIDLETEEIDLEVASDAKDLSWGALLGGAQIAGTLRHPELTAPFGGAVVQTGAAALLGGLTAGLAALPFIEPGLGQDAPCGRLLAHTDTLAPNTEADAPRRGGTSG